MALLPTTAAVTQLRTPLPKVPTPSALANLSHRAERGYGRLAQSRDFHTLEGRENRPLSRTRVRRIRFCQIAFDVGFICG